MFINIFSLPAINFTIYFFKHMKRCYDRGWTTLKARSRQLSVDAWLELYDGPDYMMDLRYSQVELVY